MDYQPTAICLLATSQISPPDTGLAQCIAVSSPHNIPFDTDLNNSAELPIVFGTHYEFRGNSTELEWLTSYAMEGNYIP